MYIDRRQNAISKVYLGEPQQERKQCVRKDPQAEVGVGHAETKSIQKAEPLAAYARDVPLDERFGRHLGQAAPLGQGVSQRRIARSVLQLVSVVGYDCFELVDGPEGDDPQRQEGDIREGFQVIYLCVSTDQASNNLETTKSALYVCMYVCI
jgi:hypothetical protein